MVCKRTLVSGEYPMCTFCRMRLPVQPIEYPFPNSMEQRILGILPFKRAFPYLKFIKHGMVQELLHELKYKGKPQIGEILGRWFGYQIKQHEVFSPELIIPVPLHPGKEKERGYNQSDFIAKGIGESLEIPLAKDILIRSKETPTQTRKSRIERWNNMDEVFTVKDPEVISYKDILLIDDVVTTGATLCSCGLSLLENGARTISFGAIALAD